MVAPDLDGACFEAPPPPPDALDVPTPDTAGIELGKRRRSALRPIAYAERDSDDGGAAESGSSDDAQGAAGRGTAWRVATGTHNETRPRGKKRQRRRSSAAAGDDGLLSPCSHIDVGRSAEETLQLQKLRDYAKMHGSQIPDGWRVEVRWRRTSASTTAG